MKQELLTDWNIICLRLEEDTALETFIKDNI